MDNPLFRQLPNPLEHMQECGTEILGILEQSFLCNLSQCFSSHVLHMEPSGLISILIYSFITAEYGDHIWYVAEVAEPSEKRLLFGEAFRDSFVLFPNCRHQVISNVWSD